MNWHVFEYAGPTALAWTALMVSFVALVVVLALFGWLVWRGARKGAPLLRRILCLGVQCARGCGRDRILTMRGSTFSRMPEGAVPPMLR